ncbi:MAG: CDP-glucose 4,6-dehydratase [Paludibacter sp.]|nr:CDP-glucose 4,6-dehydratase [Paludibacter sp.]
MVENFYKGKTVLVTGHTGFKGSWLIIWLLEMGARVIGYSLDPVSEKDNFVLSGIGIKIVDLRGDIRNPDKLKEVMSTYQPEIVFHMAAQALVRLSYEIPAETYDVNLIGSINVLEAIRATESVRVGIMVTTDKCYENKEQITPYTETDSLGGYDPYSSSKAACEIAIVSWRNSFFNLDQFSKHGKAIVSVRAGNVIGGGDWALDRIIPDCIRSLEDNKPIEIRSPKSIRPWQHVLEPLGGYLLLAKKAYEDPEKYSQAWNFGPNVDAVATVWDIAQLVLTNYGEGSIMDVSDPQNVHEAKLLLLDISKAKNKLGWEPRLTLDETIKLTVDWYKRYTSMPVLDLCLEQIRYYMKKR